MENAGCQPYMNGDCDINIYRIFFFSFLLEDLPDLRCSICADIEVPKTATVLELKQAVEAVFSHMPQKGPGKISWYVHIVICLFWIN